MASRRRRTSGLRTAWRRRSGCRPLWWATTVRPAESWQVEGALAHRAQAAALRFVGALPEPERRPFQVLVEQCPAEHAGLGVGTQLALALAYSHSPQ